MRCLKLDIRMAPAGVTQDGQGPILIQIRRPNNLSVVPFAVGMIRGVIERQLDG